MRCSLVLLVSLAVLLSIFLPAIEAAAARRRGKAGRRGAVSSSKRGRQQEGRRGRVQARHGRQDADAAGADANAVDAESELPNGCDSMTEIGNFLSYPKLLMWCIEVGEIDPESLGLYKPLLAILEAKADEEEEGAEE